MVKVKICGVTNWADAKLAVDAGADALGFNFYPRSPRYVSPEQARQIGRRLPAHVEAVGVFVDEPFAAVDEMAGELELDFVQVHGHESPETVADFARCYPVIKAFRVGHGFRLAVLAAYPKASAFLLDSFSRNAAGGTGKTFDWGIAQKAKRYGQIFLAGGVRPENVAQAILEVRPYAIDVCSGVEAKPGKKDPACLRELMRQVETANRELK